MSKKKQFIDSCDKYQQTHITNYFRIKREMSTAITTVIKHKQSSINKENDSDELAHSPRKKPKPIATDDENDSDTDEFVRNLLAPLNTIKSEVKCKRVPPAMQEYPFPFPLPSYKCSDDSDTDAGSDSKTVLQKKSRKASHKRKQTSAHLQSSKSSISSTARNTLQNSPDNGLVDQQIIVLISDDDFEEIPEKLKKVESFSPNSKKTSPNKKSEKTWSNSINKQNGELKSRKRLYKSEVGKPPEQDLSLLQSAIEPSINSKVQELLNNEPSTSTTLTSAEKRISTNKIFIGVHRPTIVPTVKEKRKPNILEKKSFSDPNLLPTTEFISTDFVSESNHQILSTSISSNTSNDTVVYEQDVNFTITQNLNATPKQIVTILEDIVITPRKASAVSSRTCSLSPIKLNPSTSKENVIVTSTPKPTKDANKSDQNKASATNSGDDDSENKWIPIVYKLFTKIVLYIVSHSHLHTMLTRNEAKTLQRFLELPKPHYGLFCLRLYTRINTWYNIFKLNNILKLNLTDPEVKEMYDCLAENGFVDVDFSSEACIDLLHRLSKKQVKEICDSFKIKLSPKETKDGLVKKLLVNCNRQSTLTFVSTENLLNNRIKEKMGICVKLNSNMYNLLNKVHLLYTFTTYDFEKTSDLYFFLSKIHFKDIIIPKIRINENVQVFASISEFSSFANARECRVALDQAFQKKDMNLMLDLCKFALTELQRIVANPVVQKPSYLMHFTAGYQYTEALSTGAKHLTRHYPEVVQDILIYLLCQNRYCLRKQGYWYDLLIMVQFRYLKQHEAAVETLIEALKNNDLSDVDRYDLAFRAQLIKKSQTYKISELQSNKISFVQPAPLEELPFKEITAVAARTCESDNSAKWKRRQYVKKTEQEERVSNVEDTALDYYLKNTFANGLHCEGSLLNTLFFILFWDVIYESNVAAAFITEIQYYPLDLMSREFYTNRKSAIDRRLDEIKSKWPGDQLKGFICDMWEKHAHEKSYISDTVVNEPEQLFDIILCIGRVTLSKCFERLVSDFKLYHSGLPDLFLWNVRQRKSKFVEVKSETDKLSTKQTLWLNFLRSVGADVEVCCVRAIGSQKSAKPKRIKSEIKKEEKCRKRSSK